jgi:hypothetical protein
VTEGLAKKRKIEERKKSDSLVRAVLLKNITRTEKEGKGSSLATRLT